MLLAESINITNAPKISKPNLPRLLDGKYYKVLNESFSSASPAIEAECQTCHKVRKGHFRSTGNFLEHYKSCHPELLKEVNEYKKQKCESGLKQMTLVSKILPLTPKIVSLSWSTFCIYS